MVKKKVQKFKAPPIPPNPVDVATWACKKVRDRGEATSNCGICGMEDDEHEDDCPYPEAVEFLTMIGV